MHQLPCLQGELCFSVGQAGSPPCVVVKQMAGRTTCSLLPPKVGAWDPEPGKQPSLRALAEHNH